jgi:hypothetical protein
LETLTYEPHFERYVRDAFAPVGLMIDLWQERIAGGTTMKIPVSVINDLYRDWEGTVLLRLKHKGQAIGSHSASCKVPSLGRVVLNFSQALPKEPGAYELVAELTGAEGKPVRSLRAISVRE